MNAEPGFGSRLAQFEALIIAFTSHDCKYWVANSLRLVSQDVGKPVSVNSDTDGV